ncbi:jg21507 [Pararge aegeria aegeria]|uniref:Jg21507 protein n=1 Tax=Pararge aegeria aegeria TaxID=348720 RepID=A0A8S4RR97_9NEOP|nr:jg21507 [Pararge aegeria aegeria]
MSQVWPWSHRPVGVVAPRPPPDREHLIYRIKDKPNPPLLEEVAPNTESGDSIGIWDIGGLGYVRKTLYKIHRQHSGVSQWKVRKTRHLSRLIYRLRCLVIYGGQ